MRIFRISRHLFLGVLFLVVLTLSAKPVSAAALGDFDLVTNYCPERYLQFWDTVVFTISADVLNNSKGKTSLHSGLEYDVKLQRDTESVGNVRQLLVDRLTEMGFVAENGQVQVHHIGQLVHVQSTVVCSIPTDLRLPRSQ